MDACDKESERNNCANEQYAEELFLKTTCREMQLHPLEPEEKSQLVSEREKCVVVSEQCLLLL